ncbi:MAG: DUF1415 domain-containing protein [Methylococcales bacterium]|nr:DUF1415 domain-containing protein [Methylococcales bacterium]MCK5924300.1 DUF1415 domain-containing protein [Methylococcales bacterium]
MSKDAKQQTEHWLNRFIIGHNVCPFAHAVVEKGQVFYALDSHIETEACLHQLIEECQRLDEQDAIETTLIIYTHSLKTFDDFLAYLEIANALLIAQHYEGVYQLASFHPDYCFEGLDEDDAANYTNRSPFPMLHLIREKSLERVLKSYPHPEDIPERNITLTRQLGTAALKALLADIKLANYP